MFTKHERKVQTIINPNIPKQRPDEKEKQNKNNT